MTDRTPSDVPTPLDPVAAQPEVEPVAEPAIEPVAEPAIEPVPEAQPGPEAQPEPVAAVVAAEPGPEAQPEPEAVGAAPESEPAPAAEPEPVVAAEPGPVAPVVPEALDASALVPLEEIAPAIAAASVSRRAFLGFGLMVAGGLAGAAGLSRLFPVFEESTDPASPIVGRYDPAGKAWTLSWNRLVHRLRPVRGREQGENNISRRRLTRGRGSSATSCRRTVPSSHAPRPACTASARVHGRSVPARPSRVVLRARPCMQCANSRDQVCPGGATYRTEVG